MKAAKIKSCGPCPYRGHKADICTILMEDGYPVDITEQIEKQAIHPSCPLSDWPEVDEEWIREWAVKFNNSVDIATTIENFTNSIHSIGVIIREREEEKDGK